MPELAAVQRIEEMEQGVQVRLELFVPCLQQLTPGAQHFVEAAPRREPTRKCP
jgi:hypothetical protein